MIINKKPSQIINIKKIIMLILLLGATITIYIYKDKITENEYIKDLLNNFYSLGLFSAKTYNLIDKNIGLFLSYLFATILIFYVIKSIYHILYIKKTNYMFDFDNGSIIIEEGIFNKEKDAISLSAIIDIDVKQNFVELIFKRHTIYIFTRGDLTPSEGNGLTKKEKEYINKINETIEYGYVGMKKIKSIKNPEEIFNKIRNSISINQ